MLGKAADVGMLRPKVPSKRNSAFHPCCQVYESDVGHHVSRRSQTVPPSDRTQQHPRRGRAGVTTPRAPGNTSTTGDTFSPQCREIANENMLEFCPVWHPRSPGQRTGKFPGVQCFFTRASFLWGSACAASDGTQARPRKTGNDADVRAEAAACFP